MIVPPVTIGSLISIVAPPVSPEDNEGDWGDVEDSLGTDLPDDFKDLVRAYGSGSFCGISVWSPFNGRFDGEFSLLVRAESFLDDFAIFREKNPEEFEYPIFPEEDGLLEWASAANGAKICWLAQGSPNAWPVVVWDYGYGSSLFRLSAVEFLELYLTGNLDEEQVPSRPVCPWFDQMRNLVEVTVTLSPSGLARRERLRAIVEACGPVVDRGDFEWDGGERQNNLALSGGEWFLTYISSGERHWVKISFPEGDSDRVEALVRQAVRGMGCDIVEALDDEGELMWER